MLCVEVPRNESGILYYTLNKYLLPLPLEVATAITSSFLLSSPGCSIHSHSTNKDIQDQRDSYKLSKDI